MEEVITVVPQVETLKAHEGRGDHQNVYLHQIGKKLKQNI